jgi:hypothetical protein
MPRSEPGKPPTPPPGIIRISPAWGSADALLDELSAADKRELLPGLSAKIPAGIPSGSSLV